jgi:hypothetical protein
LTKVVGLLRFRAPLNLGNGRTYKLSTQEVCTGLENILNQ